MEVTIDKCCTSRETYTDDMRNSDGGIDKTIEFFYGLECYTPQAKDARDTAIATMRKYQRIQEIVKAWNDMNSFDSMVQISEVLEDGNDEV